MFSKLYAFLDYMQRRRNKFFDGKNIVFIKNASVIGCAEKMVNAAAADKGNGIFYAVYVPFVKQKIFVQGSFYVHSNKINE